MNQLCGLLLILLIGFGLWWWCTNKKKDHYEYDYSKEINDSSANAEPDIFWGRRYHENPDGPQRYRVGCFDTQPANAGM